MKHPEPFAVICAWCLRKEDRITVIGRSKVPHSHGICRRHRQAWEAEVMAFKKAKEAVG